LFLCFNWAPRHEGVLGEWRYSSIHSLTSALDGNEWSVSCPDCFTTRESTPGTHWIGGWVGPRAILDMMVKRKFPAPHQESNPRMPIVQPVAQHYTNLAITNDKCLMVHYNPSPLFQISKDNNIFHCPDYPTTFIAVQD
jgi:hypothetical protein